MYGLLNSAVKEYIVTNFGIGAWKLISPDIDNFDYMAPYPDDVTYEIINRASSILNIDTDPMLHIIGEAWVKHTDARGYGLLFDAAGGNLKHFLLDILPEMHGKIQKSFPHLNPPVFKVETVNSDTLKLRYTSHRHGFCPLIPGILSGLSKRFSTELNVKDIQCMRSGSVCCEFLIQIK